MRDIKSRDVTLAISTKNFKKGYRGTKNRKNINLYKSIYTHYTYLSLRIAEKKSRSPAVAKIVEKSMPVSRDYEYHKVPQVPQRKGESMDKRSKLAEYERRKQDLQNQCTTSEEYQNEIIKLCKELKI